MLDRCGHEMRAALSLRHRRHPHPHPRSGADQWVREWPPRHPRRARRDDFETVRSQLLNQRKPGALQRRSGPNIAEHYKNAHWRGGGSVRHALSFGPPRSRYRRPAGIPCQMDATSRGFGRIFRSGASPAARRGAPRRKNRARAELERLAARPSVDAWLEQVRKRKRAAQTRVSSRQITLGSKGNGLAASRRLAMSAAIPHTDVGGRAVSARSRSRISL